MSATITKTRAELKPYKSVAPEDNGSVMAWQVHFDAQMIADFWCYENTHAKADAELIVRAVNSFDDLLAACKAALAEMDDYERHESLEVFSSDKLLVKAIEKAEKP